MTVRVSKKGLTGSFPAPIGGEVRFSLGQDSGNDREIIHKTANGVRVGNHLPWVGENWLASV